MKDVAIKAAKWMLEKYAPEYHVHKSPTRKAQERPPLQSREEYMAWRKSVKAPPDPKDYEDPTEWEHEREKYQMMMEARAEGDR